MIAGCALDAVRNLGWLRRYLQRLHDGSQYPVTRLRQTFPGCCVLSFQATYGIVAVGQDADLNEAGMAINADAVVSNYLSLGGLI